jgi:hypothetical protein
VPEKQTNSNNKIVKRGVEDLVHVPREKQGAEKQGEAAQA